MIKLKNIVSYLFLVIIIAFALFRLGQALIHKDYLALFEFISLIITFILYKVIDSKLIRPLRIKAKNQELFNSLAWGGAVIFAIANFIMYILSKNDIVEIIHRTLLYQSIYFSAEYWRNWMDDEEEEL